MHNSPYGGRPHERQQASTDEENTKGKKAAYKDMHTLYEAEQKRVDSLCRDEAPRESNDIDWADPTRSSL